MKRIALIFVATLPIIIAALCVFGWFADCEYIHWPMLWKASRAKTSDGVRVRDLIQARASSSNSSPHWHHCGFCNLVYSHASNTAIKVRVSANKAFLFDWDSRNRRLLPITLHTAETFPELIPPGFVAQPSSSSELGAHFEGDRPCQIVPGLLSR